MQYKVRLAILLSSILLPVLGTAASADDPLKAVIAGRDAHFFTPPILRDGSVYVPMTVLQALGASGKLTGRPGKSDQKVEIDPSVGDSFECTAKLIDGQAMLPIRDIAQELGAYVELDEISKRLSIRSQIRRIDFDGTRLVIDAGYPVTCKVSMWSRKLILDVAGAHLSRQAASDIRNSTSVALRTGVSDDGESVRVVLDLPKTVKYRTENAPKTTRISVAITPPVTPGAAGPSLVPSGRVAAPGQTIGPETKPEQPVIAKPTPPPTPDTPPIEVTSVEYRKRSSRAVDVEIKTSRPVKPTTYLTRHPDKLFIDYRGAVLSGDRRETKVDHQLLRTMHVYQQNDSLVRIALDLTRVVGFDASRDSSGTKLTIHMEIPKHADGVLAGKTVVIDAGHGGEEPGALGCSGSREKNINLEIAKRVKKVLANAGVCALMTRDDDSTMSVSDRPEFASRHSADFLISIHSNKFGQTNSASGTETYYRDGDSDSKALAYAIHGEIVGVTGLPDRSVRSDTTLYKTGLGVLRGACRYGIPCTLLEIGYMNNTTDEAMLRNPDFQQRVAEAIAKGLRAYIEGSATSESRKRGSGQLSLRASASETVKE